MSAETGSFFLVVDQFTSSVMQKMVVSHFRFLSASKDQLPNFLTTISLGTEAGEGKNIIGELDPRCPGSGLTLAIQ